jgi:hypothetical protein
MVALLRSKVGVDILECKGDQARHALRAKVRWGGCDGVHGDERKTGLYLPGRSKCSLDHVSCALHQTGQADVVASRLSLRLLTCHCRYLVASFTVDAPFSITNVFDERDVPSSSI